MLILNDEPGGLHAPLKDMGRYVSPEFLPFWSGNTSFGQKKSKTSTLKKTVKIVRDGIGGCLFFHTIKMIAQRREPMFRPFGSPPPLHPPLTMRNEQMGDPSRNSLEIRPYDWALGIKMHTPHTWQTECKFLRKTSTPTQFFNWRICIAPPLHTS
jgi:hypothetical protein